MKNFTVIIFLFFVTSLVLISCKGNQKSTVNPSDDHPLASACSVEAKVMDFTGLSSCSILLELKDGTFLNPVKGVSKQDFLRAETVKVSYTNIPDAMSSCMKGQLVHITCFEVIRKGVPAKGKID